MRLYLLEGTLAWDFWLLFFFHQKHPFCLLIHTLNLFWIVNRIRRDILIIHHSALTQLTQSWFFTLSYIKTVNIFWFILAPFEHFIVNFSKSYPFKGARAGYLCLFWLDSSPLYGVDVESDSPSTESTRSETPRQLSQRGMIKSS